MKRAVLLAVVVGLTLLGTTPASARNDNKFKKFQTWNREVRTPSSPVPEPTAALVFGASLLVIGLSKRRRGDR